MKKILLSLFLTLSLSTFANAFVVNSQVSVSPLLVRATVYNPFYQPIFCTGQAQGVTYFGQYAYGYINRVLVYPGNFVNIDVFSYPQNPFVNGSAFVNCEWF